MVVVLLGTIGSNLPAIQYLGSATGVLLGFVLGIWWQEVEKDRANKEKKEQFFSEYKLFLLDLEIKVTTLKNGIGNREAIYDTLIEYRLPLPEAIYFQKQAVEINIATEIRKEITQLANQVRVIDEYMDFGTEKLKYWHNNFYPIVDALWLSLRDLNVRYSGRKLPEMLK